jgi:hypothetical protein
MDTMTENVPALQRNRKAIACQVEDDIAQRLDDQTRSGPRLVSLKNASAILSLSVATIRRQIKAGTLACVRVGGRVLLSDRNILDFITRCSRSSRPCAKEQSGGDA